MKRMRLAPLTITDDHLTCVFAWYNLVGSFAAALGAFSGGVFAQTLQDPATTPINSYRVILLGYAGFGILSAWLFTRLSPAVEVVPVVSTPGKHWLGLHRSRTVVFKLAALFMSGCSLYRLGMSCSANRAASADST
jgi:MFS family permease